MRGKVVYSSGGNYKVLTEDGTFFAKPVGKFRNEDIKILVGDEVELEINESKEGLEEINVIKSLYDRKNEFVRPNISNVDHAILVTSITEPTLNDYYLDKLITIFQSRNIEPIIIFTKGDLGISEETSNTIKEYQSNYKTLITGNIIEDEQKELLKEWLKNKFSVITGQTGVGKSTLLNNINENLNLETGEISKALGRGKHTTRHSEAFEIFENAFVVDTPGFSSLEISDLDKELIYWNFFTFENYTKDCKYRNCSHTTEDGCKVKENNFSQRTLNNYYKLLNELE